MIFTPGYGNSAYLIQWLITSVLGYFVSILRNTDIPLMTLTAHLSLVIYLILKLKKICFFEHVVCFII